MGMVRYCASGGLLVFAEGRLPADQSEYHLGAVHSPCGCNQLRCESCQAMVRSGPPGRVPAAAITPAVLYAAERWDDLLTATSISGESRIYACRCLFWDCRSDAENIDREWESATDPHMPWACVGHSVPGWPLRLDELGDVAEDADWSAIVDRILGGACPRRLDTHGLRREGPSIWLGWLYAYLAGLPQAETLSAAIGARFADPDPLVRGRVLHFFMRFPRAAGFEGVLAVAQSDIALSSPGYSIPEYYGTVTLFEVVIARLEMDGRKPDATDTRALEVLRRSTLVPVGAGQPDVLVKVLKQWSSAFNDEALLLWIAEHANEIDAAAPGRWRSLMDLMAGWYMKPALGYLIVIAGTSLIQRDTAPVAEFRQWMQEPRDRWNDDAWRLPLQSVLDAHEQKSPLS